MQTEERHIAKRRLGESRLLLDLYTFFSIGLVVLAALWWHKWATLGISAAVLVIGAILFRWSILRRGTLAAIVGAVVAAVIAVVI